MVDEGVSYRVLGIELWFNATKIGCTCGKVWFDSQIKLSDLYFGTILVDEKGVEFYFINHCFCKNNFDPDLTIRTKDGVDFEKKLSEIQSWKILK